MLILIDGLQVDVSNAEVAAATIRNLVTARDTAVTSVSDMQTKVTALETTVAQRDAEIVGLKDAAEKAKPTPAVMRDAVAEFARVSAKAKAIGANVTDEMGVIAMQRAAVDLKIGDAAKEYTEAQIAAAFDALAATVAEPVDPLRTLVQDGKPVSIGDAQQQFDDARKKRLDRFESAHKGQSATA